MKMFCWLWIATIFALASVFPPSSTGQTAWLCHTGIENIEKETGFGAVMLRAFARQAEPPWAYEWNADDTPQHDPDFTFRGVLIARREADPIISHPTDGVSYHDGDLIGDAEVAYQGLGTPLLTFWSSWREDGLINGNVYYYKLFSYDEYLNYSSGVETDGLIIGGSPTPIGLASPTPLPLAPNVRRKIAAVDLSLAPSPIFPPDVELVGAVPHDGGVWLGWVNPRDLVGWSCAGSDCCLAQGGTVLLDTDTPEGPRKSYYSKAFDLEFYTVEFRMKVLSSPALDGRLRFRSVVEPPGSIITLDISETQVRMSRSFTEVFDLDTTDDFHVYRIVGGKGYGYLYIDGRYQGGGRTTNDNPEFSGIYFGDSVGGGSRSEWDYIKYAAGSYRYPTPTPTPSAAPTPSTTRTPELPGTPSPYVLPVLCSGDYNGDGKSDIAVFRSREGKWLVKDLGTTWFGKIGDLPVPGDYDGDGVTDIGIYRSDNGLWAVKGLTRFYLPAGCVPVPADYNGDGSADAAAFRLSTGLWTVRGITQVWFGQYLDIPVPADYDGNGTDEIAVWRPGTGAWLVRGLTRWFHGRRTDVPIPGRYCWEGTPTVRDRPAVYRPDQGKWVILGGESFYHGAGGDVPLPGTYSGGVLDQAAVFRLTRSLWSVRGVTRTYFGQWRDYPVTR